jgi:class 3 adenylate cyclase
VSQTRRLAAILAADVAGYSRLMGADEEAALIVLALVQICPENR